MLKLLTILIFPALLLSCKSNPDFKLDNSVFKEADKTNRDTSRTGKPLSVYNLTHPDSIWKLDVSLNEISGINILSNGNIIALEDLHPILYEIKKSKNDSGIIIKKSTFFNTDKDKLDMEDLAVIGNDVYAIWSHGTIFKIKDWRNNSKSEELKTSLDKKNNTEGLAFDAASGKLLIACKNDAGLKDEKKSTRAIYEFDIQKNEMNQTPLFLINKKDFKKIESEKISFYPSAIAVNPVTGDIYVTSTKDTKCLAVFTSKGILKDFQYLNGDIMPQPEGMCFDKVGNLYISSEGKGSVAPAIFRFSVK